MTELNIKTAEDLANYVRQNALGYVKVGVFDVDGVMRGKYMGREKFLSSLEKGYGFCDVVLGWDSNDQLYDNVGVTGWAPAHSAAGARLRGLQRASAMRYDVLSAVEFEFFLFDETPHSIREKRYRDLRNITPG